MTVETRYHGPTNHRGARITVRREIGHGEHHSTTYSYPYAARDAHTYCFLAYMADLNAKEEQTYKIPLEVDATPNPVLRNWKRAETEKGYLYTNNIVFVEPTE